MTDTEQTPQEKAAAVIARLQLEMIAQRIEARPDSAQSDWDRGASHWLITIKRVGFGPRSPMVTFYSMGSAHKGAPKIADVLYSLTSDAQSADQSFESWAADYGYDTDSRKSEATHRECQSINRQLRALVDADGMRELSEAFEGY